MSEIKFDVFCLQPKPEDSYAWKPPDRPAAMTTATTTTATTSKPVMSTPSFSTWNGTISHFAETKSGLPLPQSPTITLLQKSRGKTSRQPSPLFCIYVR